MPKFEQLCGMLRQRVVEGSGMSSAEERREAFDGRGVDGAVGRLVDSVARNAHGEGEVVIADARAAGRSEDKIFEIAVCAAVGQATRMYEAGRAALAAAVGGRDDAARDSR